MNFWRVSLVLIHCSHLNFNIQLGFLAVTYQNPTILCSHKNCGIWWHDKKLQLVLDADSGARGEALSRHSSCGYWRVSCALVRVPGVWGIAV